MHYDAFLFIEAIRSKYWLGMLGAIDFALTTLERYPAAHNRPGPWQPGSDEGFRQFLLATRDYLLAEGRLRPEDITLEQFLLMKPLCEHLVEQGRFAPDCLALFQVPQAGMTAIAAADLTTKHRA